MFLETAENGFERLRELVEVEETLAISRIFLKFALTFLSIVKNALVAALLSLSFKLEKL